MLKRQSCRNYFNSDIEYKAIFLAYRKNQNLLKLTWDTEHKSALPSSVNYEVSLLSYDDFRSTVDEAPFVDCLSFLVVLDEFSFSFRGFRQR